MDVENLAMSSTLWKILSFVGIRRQDDCDLSPIPDADPIMYSTPERLPTKATSPGLRGSITKKHVTFSPKAENIPIYDLVHADIPEGETPIRLMRECAARASPSVNDELTSRINDLEQLIADIKGENEALVAENKRLHTENRILHDEKRRLGSSTVSEASS